MKILAIETSCDETGIALLDVEETQDDTHVELIGNELTSQIKDHQEYGGVYPSLAKRLHARNFPLLFRQTLQKTTTKPPVNFSQNKKDTIRQWFSRHPDCADSLIEIISQELPEIDAVAVTVGPGLEPALWVGINAARSIGLANNTPIIPVNHMLGHYASARAPENWQNDFYLQSVSYPAVALLVSGGHTELIHAADADSVDKIGQTRDDAAGEAFDKVGRLLGLPYPAGPHVSRLAKEARDKLQRPNSSSRKFHLPRPMIDANNLDFSFSGLKTAATRLIDEAKPLSDKDKRLFACELEAAIVDVLTKKTKQALQHTDSQTLLAGGGVTANPKLRSELQLAANQVNASFLLSPTELATDNAVMIGLAGFLLHRMQPSTTCQPGNFDTLQANSRLSL